jgi:hypothetical protein
MIFCSDLLGAGAGNADVHGFLERLATEKVVWT